MYSPPLTKCVKYDFLYLFLGKFSGAPAIVFTELCGETRRSKPHFPIDPGEPLPEEAVIELGFDGIHEERDFILTYDHLDKEIAIISQIKKPDYVDTPHLIRTAEGPKFERRTVVEWTNVYEKIEASKSLPEDFFKKGTSDSVNDYTKMFCEVNSLCIELMKEYSQTAYTLLFKEPYFIHDFKAWIDHMMIPYIEYKNSESEGVK